MGSLKWLAALLLLLALPAVRLFGVGAQENVDDRGNWTHATPPDIGVEVIEATRGFTFAEPADVSLPGGATVTMPQADGLTWYAGDTGFGYGMVVDFPSGSKVFIDYDGRRIATKRLNDADRELLTAFANSVRDFPGFDPASILNASPDEGAD